MDHPTYLEQFNDIVTKVLPEVALMQGRGDHESATQLVTQLRAKLDDMWSQRVADAERGVAP